MKLFCSWLSIVLVISTGTCLAAPAQQTIVKDIDLRSLYHLTNEWHLIVYQAPSTSYQTPVPAGLISPKITSKTITQVDDGLIKFCFLEIDAKTQLHCWPKSGDDLGFNNNLLSLEPFATARFLSQPVIIAKANGMGGTGFMAPGQAVTTTMIWTFDPLQGQFVLAFENTSNPNNNEETRFIENGPMAGDVVVATELAQKGAIRLNKSPFAYGIAVYRFSSASQRFMQILTFAGHSVYDDGDPRAVIDSDMPDTLRLLGLTVRK